MISNNDADLIKKSVHVAALLDGDMAEVGVSIGDSAEVICYHKAGKVLYLFDTFDGHPKGWVGKYDLMQEEGKHSANIEDVKSRLSKFNNVYFYKGIFPETSEPIKDKKFCFVNLDTDLYKSTYEGLKFFVPRIVKGAIILVHDSPNIPGVTCAIIDYFEKYDTDATMNNFENHNQTLIQFNG